MKLGVKLSLCGGFFLASLGLSANISYADDSVVPVHNQDGSSWGTGTYIGPNHILTAAHVVEQIQNNGGDLFIDYPDGSTSSVDPSNVSINPSYNYQNMEKGDLSVIKTDNTSSDYYTISHTPGDSYSASWSGYPINYDNANLNGTGQITQTGNINNYSEYPGRTEAGQSGSGLVANGNIYGVLSSGTNGSDSDSNDGYSTFTPLNDSNYDYVSSQLQDKY